MVHKIPLGVSLTAGFSRQDASIVFMLWPWHKVEEPASEGHRHCHRMEEAAPESRCRLV